MGCQRRIKFRRRTIADQYQLDRLLLQHLRRLKQAGAAPGVRPQVARLGSHNLLRRLPQVVAREVPPGLVVAPDEGAREWCTRAARKLKAPLHVMSKTRVDDRTVETDSGKVTVKGLTVVILDDIISTGGTIASAARLLKKAGAGQVLAACTHGLFIEDAANRLRGCDDILSSDTIEGVYTRYSVAPAIAAAL